MENEKTSLLYHRMTSSNLTLFVSKHYTGATMKTLRDVNLPLYEALIEKNMVPDLIKQRVLKDIYNLDR